MKIGIFSAAISHVLSILLLLLASAGNAAAEVQDITLSVAKIQAFKADTRICFATGFFYQAKSQHLYFVTNRHVVRRPDGIDPDKFKLLLHAGMTLTANIPFEISLYSSGKRVWREHRNVDVDLVMIPIESGSLKSCLIKPLSKKNVITDEFPVFPGESVFLMGYPLGFSDDENNLPIFRHAMIASSYGVPFEKRRMCLIDGNLQEGMSGSPILTQPTAVRVNQKGATAFAHDGMPFMLLGVLSERVPAKFKYGNPSNTSEILSNKDIELTIREEIGLANCWYPELLEEIAEGND